MGFTPDMLSIERRPFYDGFIKKTGEIAAKFVSTNPKPQGQVAGILVNRINQVDAQVGNELLTRGSDNLFVPIISLPRGRMHTIPDLIENDPLTKGLITGKDLFPEEQNRKSLYKSIIPGCFILVTIDKESVGGDEVINSYLIGSKAIDPRLTTSEKDNK